MSSEEPSEPKSTLMARQFLSKQIDWMPSYSSYYNKTYQEMIADPLDLHTMRTTGDSIIGAHIRIIDGELVYKSEVTPLVEDILNILPDFAALKNFEFMSTIISDPNNVFPALEEFIREHPEHNATPKIKKLLFLLNDYTEKAFNPSEIVKKANTHLSLLALPKSKPNDSLREEVSIKKMRQAHDAMGKLSAYFGQILTVSNRDSPLILNDPQSSFVQGGIDLGQLIDILDIMQTDLDQIIKQLEKERGNEQESAPPPLPPRKN